MDGDQSPRVGYRAALASPQLRALLAGQLVSVAGTSVAAVALTILVYRRTASPLLASLAFALGFVPYLFGGALLSGVVDRVRPRRLVVTCDLGAAVLAAAMALPGLPVAALFALLLGVGTLSSVESGARATLVRSSVAQDAYVPARSLFRIAAQLAQIGGNAAGGALLLVLTPSGALLANAGSFAFSAATARLGVADHEHAGNALQATLLRDSLHGLRAVFALPELRRLLLIGWLAPMFSVAPEALAAPYVVGHHASSALVGWWLVALPVGVIVGDVAGVRLLDQRRQRRLIAPAVALSFVPYLVFTAGPSVPVSLALLVGSGFCGLYALGLDARIRDAAPTHLFARTMTINSAGLMALQGLGFALAGAVAQLTGPGTAIALAGLCGLAVTFALLGPDLRVRQLHDRASGVAAARRQEG
jgi:MFS family permease